MPWSNFDIERVYPWTNLWAFSWQGKPISSVPLLVYVDPRAVQLIAAASDANPFGVDARSAILIS